MRQPELEIIHIIFLINWRIDVFMTMISDKDISICLIEPLYPINIGYVARIMKNFGFDKLLLCNSNTDLQKARPFASH